MLTDLSAAMFFRKTRPAIHDDPDSRARLSQWEHMIEVYVDDSALSPADRDAFRILCEVGVRPETTKAFLGRSPCGS